VHVLSNQHCGGGVLALVAAQYARIGEVFGMQPPRHTGCRKRARIVPGHAHVNNMTIDESLGDLDRRKLLLLATEDLVRAQNTHTAQEVIEAVARARTRVGAGYAISALSPPPSDEYVSLVIGMARQDLRRASRL
jgi:hypothetical protein